MRTDFSKKKKCCGIFQNYFFLPPCHFFPSGIYSENPVDLLEVTLTIFFPPPCLGLPGVLNCESCPHFIYSNLQFTDQVFLPWHWFLVSLLWKAVFICFSHQYQEQWFILCIWSSYGSKRVVDFLVFSAFYLLLGCSGNFQPPWTCRTGNHTIIFFLMFQKIIIQAKKDWTTKLGWNIIRSTMTLCISVLIFKSIVIFQKTEKLIICQDDFKDESSYTNTSGIQKAYSLFGA